MGEICYGCFRQLAKGGACPHCHYNPSEDTGKYPTALKPGTLLNNRYILGRVLGQGGFGITYAAQDLVERKRIAVKEYLPTAIAFRDVTGQVNSLGTQIENFEYGKEGFMEEANALVALKDNPYIVNVHDFFEANGTAYFVMEYVQGKNLKEYVKMMGGTLGQEAANHILLPIMDALSAVHIKGLVHRDISPDNIIVTSNGSAKLIDFGAARYSTGEKSLSLDVVLKHGYAPKEQYTRRGRQGAYTDVYAMAATYYYAVTGRVPPDAVDRMSEDDLIPPSTLGAKLSPRVEEALMKGLELEPADRYQTMGEFAAAIGDRTVLILPSREPIPPSPDILPQDPNLVKAAECLKLGDWEQAVKFCDLVLEKDKNNSAALHYREVAKKKAAKGSSPGDDTLPTEPISADNATVPINSFNWGEDTVPVLPSIDTQPSVPPEPIKPVPIKQEATEKKKIKNTLLYVIIALLVVLVIMMAIPNDNIDGPRYSPTPGVVSTPRPTTRPTPVPTPTVPSNVTTYSDGRIKTMYEYINGERVDWTYYYDSNKVFVYRIGVIPQVDWYWSDDFMPGSYTTYHCFDQISNCISFTLNFNIPTVYKGTGRGDRTLYIMDGHGQWERAKVFAYPDYNYVQVTVDLDSPTDIKAIGTLRNELDTENNYTIEATITNVAIMDYNYT